MSDLKFKFPVVFSGYVLVFYVFGFFLTLFSTFISSKFDIGSVSVFDDIFPTLGYNVNGMYSLGYEDRIEKVRIAYLSQFINGMIFMCLFYFKFDNIYKEFLISVSDYYDILEKDYGGGGFVYYVLNFMFYTFIFIACPIYINTMKFDASEASKFSNIGYISDSSLLVHTCFLFSFFSWLAGVVLVVKYLLKNKWIRG